MTEYSLAKTGEYPRLVYTKTVDSVKTRALIGSSNSEYPALFTSEQMKKSSKLIVCGAFYLTVLVYTKTTIHLSVGG